MTLDLKPEVAERLRNLAKSQGLSVEAYVQRLIEKDLGEQTGESAADEGSGMIWENGLFIYRTTNFIPDHVVDNAVRRVREERSRHVLGDHS
jgi:hypothetical protein